MKTSTAVNLQLSYPSKSVRYCRTVEKSFDSSAALARSVGVEEGEILDSYEKIVDYFC